uniref:DUF4116 domain-containing protein n=1 Tax=Alexandrium monilatum TaxID=311494 RepID=A0A6T0SP19_9DINO
MGGSESSEPAPAQEPPPIAAKALGVNGELVLEVPSLDRGQAVKKLRGELMKLKDHELPHSVAIIFNGEELQDKESFPAEAAEVEVTAVFKVLELADAERRRHLRSLEAAGFGPSADVAFQLLPAVARADREVVLAAVRASSQCLKYAHNALRNDREFMAVIVGRYPETFRDVGAAIKADREIAAKAIHANYTNFQFAADAIKEDRDIVRQAVQADGMLLKHASESMRGDRETVMMAVAQNRDALKFASEALQEDAEVIAARRPEREKTAMERAMEEQQRIDSMACFQRPAPQADGPGVEYRPVTLMDKMQITMHNNSGAGVRFSPGLSGC